MKEMRVKLTFIEEVLGTASANPELHKEFIASKSEDAMSMEEEVAALGPEKVAEKGRTIFPKYDDGVPFFWDYQVKGFFKDSCGALRRASGTESAKCKAYKKVIDGTMFVEERRIGIDMHGGEIGLCERPLRAQTAQGERVSLASSETVPAGSTVEFTVMCLNDADMKLVEEWLDYGRLRGMGQWRNSGKGRFVWGKVDEG